jgi:translocating chain-associated membrane protein 1
MEIHKISQVNNDFAEGRPVVYTNGRKDIATIAFYAICAIVVHAVLQEYVLDVSAIYDIMYLIVFPVQKLQRKLHLSKTKTSKFTESGHLAIFAAYSLGHALFIINQSSYLTDITQFWSGYPEQHRQMNIHTKVFFLVQVN